MTVLPSSDQDFRSVMASVDKDGHRRGLHVQLTGGFWRWCRAILATGLISFYLALPFLTVEGRPFLRIDIPHRHYVVAGQIFWPQDFYYLLLFLLIGAALTLFTVSLVGRFFCGWLCPHSVFMEMVYRPIERLIQGPPARRARAAREGHDRLRRVVTWGTFVLVSGALANTATAIFVGTDAFIGGLLINPLLHPAAAVFFTVFFALILINFGWFREQMCTIVCPYGRLQSVMLDAHSLVVAYDARRGEPRGKPGTVTGDCIDCRLCVAVCPTGIDIRNGSQMECIHCAACIDACDGVMKRMGKAPGLVRYGSGIGMTGGHRRIFRFRTALYATAAIMLCTLAGWKLAHRDALVASRLRTNIAPVLFCGNDGTSLVRQVVPLSLVNRSNESRTCTIELPSGLGGTILLAPATVVLPADARVEITPVVDVPSTRFHDGELSTVLTVISNEGRITLPITLRAP